MATSSATPESTAHVQRQLDMANSQLALYARDLKRLLERERQTSRDLTSAYQQMQAFARDLKKAFDAERRRSRQLEKAYCDTVRRLTRAARYKDNETGAHLQRLSHYAKALTLHVGMNVLNVELIFAAAPMHDVGKIGVPDAMLRKPGPLNQQEWQVMKKHAALGASLLKGSTSPLMDMAQQIALTHHEHWDGSGYPQGLKGEEIPLVGRIVMLADVYDALRSKRSYKPAFDHVTACNIILKGDERTRPEHFDPRLLAAFRELHHKFDTIYTRFRD